MSALHHHGVVTAVQSVEKLHPQGLDVALDLVRHVHLPHLVARGRRFAGEEVSPATNGNVMASHAEAVVQMGELMTAGALAFADGKLTPAEAQQIDRALAKVEAATAEYRKVLAAVRGQGGLSIVGGAA